MTFSFAEAGFFKCELTDTHYDNLSQVLESLGVLSEQIDQDGIISKAFELIASKSNRTNYLRQWRNKSSLIFSFPLLAEKTGKTIVVINPVLETENAGLSSVIFSPHGYEIVNVIPDENVVVLVFMEQWLRIRPKTASGVWVRNLLESEFLLNCLASLSFPEKNYRLRCLDKPYLPAGSAYLMPCISWRGGCQVISEVDKSCFYPEDLLRAMKGKIIDDQIEENYEETEFFTTKVMVARSSETGTGIAQDGQGLNCSYCLNILHQTLQWQCEGGEHLQLSCMACKKAMESKFPECTVCLKPYKTFHDIATDRKVQEAPALCCLCAFSGKVSEVFLHHYRVHQSMSPGRLFRTVQMLPGKCGEYSFGPLNELVWKEFKEIAGITLIQCHEVKVMVDKALYSKWNISSMPVNQLSVTWGFLQGRKTVYKEVVDVYGFLAGITLIQCHEVKVMVDKALYSKWNISSMPVNQLSVIFLQGRKTVYKEVVDVYGFLYQNLGVEARNSGWQKLYEYGYGYHDDNIYTILLCEPVSSTLNEVLKDWNQFPVIDRYDFLNELGNIIKVLDKADKKQPFLLDLMPDNIGCLLSPEGTWKPKVCAKAIDVNNGSTLVDSYISCIATVLSGVDVLRKKAVLNPKEVLAVLEAADIKDLTVTSFVEQFVSEGVHSISAVQELLGVYKDGCQHNLASKRDMSSCYFSGCTELASLSTVSDFRKKLGKNRRWKCSECARVDVPDAEGSVIILSPEDVGFSCSRCNKKYCADCMMPVSPKCRYCAQILTIHSEVTGVIGCSCGRIFREGRWAECTNQQCGRYVGGCCLSTEVSAKCQSCKYLCVRKTAKELSCDASVWFCASCRQGYAVSKQGADCLNGVKRHEAEMVLHCSGGHYFCESCFKPLLKGHGYNPALEKIEHPFKKPASIVVKQKSDYSDGNPLITFTPPPSPDLQAQKNRH